jgi:hypothetical protein
VSKSCRLNYKTSYRRGIENVSCQIHHAECQSHDEKRGHDKVVPKTPHSACRNQESNTLLELARQKNTINVTINETINDIKSDTTKYTINVTINETINDTTIHTAN